MSECREFYLVHRHGYTEGWIYNYRDSAEKRLTSGLKAPPDAHEYRITRAVELKPGEIILDRERLKRVWDYARDYSVDYNDCFRILERELFGDECDEHDYVSPPPKRVTTVRLKIEKQGEEE